MKKKKRRSKKSKTRRRLKKSSYKRRKTLKIKRRKKKAIRLKRRRRFKKIKIKHGSKNILLKIIRFQDKLTPRLNFSFNLDKAIQGFFQKISDKID